MVRIWVSSDHFSLGNNFSPKILIQNVFIKLVILFPDKQVSVKRHRRNQSSCGGNKIIVDVNSLSVDSNKQVKKNESPNNEKAVCFDSAYKHYGKGRNKHPVLLGLDLNAEKGKIYGLLGKLKVIHKHC